MKSFLLACVLCLASFFSEAQGEIVKDSLRFSTVISLNEKVDFEDYQIKFKNVITDSRCPKSVMCIRAGEAYVLVSIYKNGDFIEDKKIRIDASGYVMASTNLVLDAKDFKIYGFALTPYPVDTNDTLEKDYELEIVIKPKRLE